VESLDAIRSALEAHQPATEPADGRVRAAVAMCLREHAGVPEVLFIERARRPGDPWSGHMAFPGGRTEPGDAGPRSAAERETLEEVGIDLAAAESLGRLDDLHGHRAAGVPRLVVSAFVYFLPEAPVPVPNHEVEEAFWFPLRELCDPSRQVEYRVMRASYPGILVGEPERHVVWGLTYRFLEVFFRAVGRPLPDRWAESSRSAGP
jgi:8-oxo-dGTP pyrophosphatase MutT (NUDIX family)